MPKALSFRLIRTADDAVRAVASLRCAPAGDRGFGPFIAAARWGVDVSEYQAGIEPHLVCCLLLETADAVRNVDAILDVPGIDRVIPAQFDLSTDLGLSGQFEHQGFQAAVRSLEAACTARGIPLGNVALTRPQARALLERGIRVLVGFDALWLRARAMEAQAWLKD